MKRICPNCAEFIDKKYSVCPKCGKPIHGAKNKKDSEPTYSNRSNNIKTNLSSDKSSQKKARRGLTFADIEAIPDNSVHINTKDSIYYTSGEYSARKARGEYSPEKLKWWEIYKWADQTMTRRKINKIVNRNSNMPPNNLSIVNMILLTLLIGYTGLNHIYSKNYRRGIVMISLLTVSLTVIGLSDSVQVLKSVIYSLGAFPGLIVLIMWIYDIFRVIFKKYVYKRSRLEYIKKLDIETRAKISKKYIDMSKFEEKSKRKSYVKKDKENEEPVL